MPYSVVPAFAAFAPISGPVAVDGEPPSLTSRLLKFARLWDRLGSSHDGPGVPGEVVGGGGDPEAAWGHGRRDGAPHRGPGRFRVVRPGNMACGRFEGKVPGPEEYAAPGDRSEWPSASRHAPAARAIRYGSRRPQWNSVAGCTKVSLGCDHWYAETPALGRLRQAYLSRTPVVHSNGKGLRGLRPPRSRFLKQRKVAAITSETHPITDSSLT